jgi:hypothetical protein
LLCCLCISSSAQSFRGTVLDKETALPLSYASIGVKGKSIGGIADKWGKFNIDISQAGPGDSIIISYTGYEDVRLVMKGLGLNASNEIRLQPKAKDLPEVFIVPKKDLLALGNTKYSARFTGWGDYNSSRGRLRGIRIEPKEFPVRVTEFAVRFKDNEFDSVKLRLHIQTYHPDALQGKDLLRQTVFFTVIKNQDWVYVDLQDHNIVVTVPIILSVEWVDAWASQEKKNKGSYLFTFSLDKKGGYMYQRNTPQEPYSVNFTNETPTMYLKGFKIRENK